MGAGPRLPEDRHLPRRRAHLLDHARRVAGRRRAARRAAPRAASSAAVAALPMPGELDRARDLRADLATCTAWRTCATRAASWSSDGEPLALGVVAIGDALIHTNPIAGRGLLASPGSRPSCSPSALRKEPDDLRALALHLEPRVEREIVPWYELQLAAGPRRDRGRRDAAARRESRSGSSAPTARRTRRRSCAR